MLKSSGAMAGATLVSRLLGMVREIVYARFMGDGWGAGAFQFAFTIPNLFRRLLGDDGNAQRTRPFFHPGDGRNDAQRGDDCLRALARADDGIESAEGRAVAAS